MRIGEHFIDIRANDWNQAALLQPVCRRGLPRIAHQAVTARLVKGHGQGQPVGMIADQRETHREVPEPRSRGDKGTR